MIPSKKNIDTGKLLHDFIEKNKITKATLGNDIKRNGLAILRYTRNCSIQTGILIDICYALEHNFFKDIADKLPENFTKTKPDDLTAIIEKDLLIAQLQEENKVLKIKNEVLMSIKG